MNANLMRASGFQPAGQQRITGQTLQHINMRDRLLADAGLSGASPPAVAAVSHEARDNALRRHETRHHGKIAADDRVRVKLLAQSALSGDRAREHYQAARFLIEPMDDP